MEGLELLKTRRSVRAFKKLAIDEVILDRVLNAATYAPSGMGKQAAQIVLVRDEETLGRLSKMNAKFFGQDIDPYYGAPAVALVFAPEDVVTYIEDGTAVLIYMMLAAHEEGLASVWVHREREMFDSAEGKDLLAKWEISENYKGIGALSIGYPDGDYPVAAPRREGYIKKL